METIAIERMQDFSEIVHYEHTGIPQYIRTADLAIYPGMSAPCHWYDDIEWIYIICTIAIHIKGQDCHFLCILFHPSLFGSNKIFR